MSWMESGSKFAYYILAFICGISYVISLKMSELDFIFAQEPY